MNVGHVLCPERQIEQQNSLKLKQLFLQTSAFVLYPRKHEEEH